jgi:hypothetical protein
MQERQREAWHCFLSTRLLIFKEMYIFHSPTREIIPRITLKSPAAHELFATELEYI